jgi:DNA-binding Xre family transcriptional regulator
MMKLTVKEVAQAKGFKNAKHLADAMSDHFGQRISYATIYPLWDDTAQLFSRPTLDRLCKFLNVPIGMLIQFIDTDSLQPGDPSQSAGAAKPAKRERRTKGEASKSRKAAPARPAVAMG